MKLTIAVIFLFFVSGSTIAQQYKPDDAGSKIHFVIKNFGINTGGDFNLVDGEIRFDPQSVLQSSFDVTVKSSTIDTDNNMRDKSLRDDYFESEKFPLIRITSSKIEKTNKTDDGFYYFTGQLIMKNICKQISFPFKAEQSGDNYLFTGDFEINRLDYNIGKSSTVLSSRVKVSLKVFAKKK